MKEIVKMLVFERGLNRWKLRLKYRKLKTQCTGFQKKKNYSQLKTFHELENGSEELSRMQHREKQKSRTGFKDRNTEGRMERSNEYLKGVPEGGEIFFNKKRKRYSK